jgi:chromosomal replication initiator protein
MRYSPALLKETFRIKLDPHKNKLKPSIRDIKLVIYDKLDISETEADSRFKNFQLVEARQIAQAICNKFKDRFGWSQEMIGKEIGGKDHATVIHSAKIVKCHYELEECYAQRFDRIERIIKSRFNLDTKRN